MGLAVLLLYAILGIFAISYCIARSSRYVVVSSFVGWLPQKGSDDDPADDMLMGCALVALAPDFILTMIVGGLFAVTFWPLTCLWDLSEIPRKRRAKFMLLKAKQATRQEEREASRISKAPKWLIGKSGTTVGTLSPMGQVRIGGKLWEAVSMDGFMGSAEPVVVTGRRGRAVEVTQADEDA